MTIDQYLENWKQGNSDKELRTYNKRESKLKDGEYTYEIRVSFKYNFHGYVKHKHIQRDFHTHAQSEDREPYMNPDADLNNLKKLVDSIELKRKDLDSEAVEECLKGE